MKRARFSARLLQASEGLRGRPSPNVTALSPRVLVRAAFLCGRGFPTAEAAERLQCCPRKLGTELNRLGMDRAPPPPAGADVLELRVKLSRAERTTLGTAALEACMYQPAVLVVVLRAALARGQAEIARLLHEGGAR